jgi:ParB/RepB/Spo0J family partition protein
MAKTKQIAQSAGDDMGFHPGFPPGFDPKRAEQGLPQEDRERLHNDSIARWSRKPKKEPESPKCICGETEGQHDGPGGVCGIADCGCCGFTPAGTAIAPAPITTPVFLQIPIDQIAPSPTNPRKFFDQAKLQELADSIEAHGLIEPILVRPRPGKFSVIPAAFTPRWAVVQAYGVTCSTHPTQEEAEAEAQRLNEVSFVYELVAGERRLRAAKLAGLETIEAKVRDLDDRAVLEIQLIENLQREDVSPIEEADGYCAMLDLKNLDGTSVYTVDSLAAKIGKKGKSKSYVYSRLKLRNLPAPALEALAKGDLPATIGELIGRLPSMEMRERFWNDEFEDYGTDYFQVPSFREVKQIIERAYMRELKSALFSRTDGKLLPAAGACKNCPKMTGNNRAEYPDARADMCTDTDCYDQKCRAIDQRKLQKAATNGARVLSPEESQQWFGYSYMVNNAKTRDYIDLSETCDEAAPDDWEAETPTYAQLLGDSVKTEVVGLDGGGQVHRLVSREAAEAVLRETGIKIAKSTEQVLADRKASQQNFKQEKEIRHAAAAEICERVVQSLTDNPFFIDSKIGNRDAGGFLKAVALALIRDFDIAKFVAKRRALEYGNEPRKFAAKILSDLSEAGTIELIVEYLIAEELDWWIRSGSSKDAPICEYFGHDPQKIEKRIAKERAAAKKSKPKAKAVATA